MSREDSASNWNLADFLNRNGFLLNREHVVSIMQNMQTTKDYRNASPMKPVQSFDRDCDEKTLRQAMTMSIFCNAHPLTSLRNILRKHKVVYSSHLRRMPSGSRVGISGMVIIVHTPPTKSGKRVIFLTLEDEMGHTVDVLIPVPPSYVCSGQQTLSDIDVSLHYDASGTSKACLD